METACFHALLHAMPTLLTAGPANAPSVEVVGCPTLSGDRIAEHLMVEHPEFRHTASPRVELTCTEDRVLVTVERSTNSPKAQRTVRPTATRDGGAEREIALAVSSLIVASRSDPPLPKLHPSKAPLPPPTPVAPVTHDPKASGSLQISTGIRFRDLGHVLVASHTGFRAGGFVGNRIEIFGEASVDYGRASRDRGEVGVFGALVGPGLAWTPVLKRRLGLETSASLKAGYGRIVGRTSVPDVRPRALGGGTGEVSVGFGPKVRLSAFVVVVEFQAGYTLPTPRGHVTDELRVQLGGFWAGVGLRAGPLLFGHR